MASITTDGCSHLHTGAITEVGCDAAIPIEVSKFILNFLFCRSTSLRERHDSDNTVFGICFSPVCSSSGGELSSKNSYGFSSHLKLTNIYVKQVLVVNVRKHMR